MCSKEIHAEILFKNFIATVIILCKIQGCLSWFTATIKYQHFIFYIRIRPIQNASKYFSYYSTCYHSNGFLTFNFKFYVAHWYEWVITWLPWQQDHIATIECFTTHQSLLNLKSVTLCGPEYWFLHRIYLKFCLILLFKNEKWQCHK